MAHVPAHERRIQLIEAASRVISRHGVTEATTRAIAAEAGAPQATIHYVFGSKEALFLALLQWSTTATDEFLDEARVPTGSGVANAIARLLRDYRDVDHSIIYAQFELVLWSMRTEVASSEGSDLYKRLRSQISSALQRAATKAEQALDFDFLARLLLIACDGIQFGLLAAGDDYFDPEDIPGVADALVRIAKKKAKS